ncbi:MAG: SusC/RagA family TonB-linked outer membrane protein [Chitinophagaceae bacterium]|nr:SusC/RagA family TonB-linked outer membrane protein [Chitinophagaceae bacterium]
MLLKFYGLLRSGTFFAVLLLFSCKLIAQEISLSVQEQPLEKVFLLIEKQSPYRFIYTSEAMAPSKPVSLQVKDEKIERVLALCFAGQPLQYTISNHHVVVQVKMVPKKEIKDRILQGKVINEAGEPVIGATVSIKGTPLVTITTNDGEFYFPAAPTIAQLIVSGAEIDGTSYTSRDLAPVLIRVAVRINALNETIVKGYYTTTKKDNTGSVGKVTAKQISTQPVSNPIAALQGRTPGLLITQSNGLPGAGFTVQIRGRNSILNGNNPLYVLDGVILNSDNLSQSVGVNINNPFNTIVPDDIESIEVLKDADATSLYGSRGANGVILISTKKAKAGKGKLEANFSTGWGRAGRTLDYLNTQQYIAMRKEAFANDGIQPDNSNAGDLLLWDTTRYTNWKKNSIGHTARTTNVQLRYSGGTTQTTYAVSSSYYRESTILPGDFADQRFTLLTRITSRSLNKRFEFSIQSNYSDELNQLVNQDLSVALQLPPNAPPVYNQYGELNWRENGYPFSNPIALTRQTYTGHIQRITSNGTVSYQIFPALQFSITGGMNNQYFREKGLTPISSQDPAYTPKGSAYFGNRSLQSWNADVQFNYSRKFGHRLLVQGFLGSSWQHSKTEGQLLNGSGYNDDLLLKTISGASIVNATDHYTLYRYHAFSGRFSLSYSDKYILNFTGRRDGSSRFGPGKQYANFGAVGMAWLFSKEKWASSLYPILSFGKLRLSYGITGNDQIGDYQYFDTYQPTRYPFMGSPGLRPTRLFNPSYGWEQKSNFDMALETGWFKDKVQLSVNWFRSLSGNQIIPYTLPGQTGFTSIVRNFPGLVENKGWEFEAGANLLSVPGFNWRTDLNLTIARNTLLRFPGLASSSYASTYAEGYPLGVRYLYDYTGVDPSTGIYSFTDFNQDGIINAADRKILRHTNPSFYGGWQHQLTVKQFEFGLFFQFVKQDGTDLFFSLFSTPGREANEPLEVLDRWQKPGDHAKYQRFTTGTGPAAAASYQTPYSTAAITDASYIRLKNFSIQYLLPQRYLQQWSLASAKLFLQVQNLLTISNYSGPDPENQSLRAIPPLRMIAAGVRLIF